MIEEPADAINQVRVTDGGARGEVVVPVEVLGATVQRQIESDLGGPEVHGARERVVHHRNELVRFRELDDRVQVRHLHEGVRDRFHEDHARVGAHRLPPVLWIVPIDEGVRDPEAGQIFGHEASRAAVRRVEDEQMIAGAEDGEQARRDRRHAAGGHQRRLGALDRRELAVQDLMVGRVAQPDVPARVVIALALVEIRGCLEDGHGDGAAESRARLTGMHDGRVDRIGGHWLRPLVGLRHPVQGGIVDIGSGCGSQISPHSVGGPPAASGMSLTRPACLLPQAA